MLCLLKTDLSPKLFYFTGMYVTMFSMLKSSHLFTSVNNAAVLVYKTNIYSFNFLLQHQKRRMGLDSLYIHWNWETVYDREMTLAKIESAFTGKEILCAECILISMMTFNRIKCNEELH